MAFASSAWHEQLHGTLKDSLPSRADHWSAAALEQTTVGKLLLLDCTAMQNSFVLLTVSKEILVRIEGFVKIMAMVRPAKGL